MPLPPRVLAPPPPGARASAGADTVSTKLASQHGPHRGREEGVNAEGASWWGAEERSPRALSWTPTAAPGRGAATPARRPVLTPPQSAGFWHLPRYFLTMTCWVRFIISWDRKEKAPRSWVLELASRWWEAPVKPLPVCGA